MIMEETTYHGFAGHTFDFEGHTATIIYPKRATWAKRNGSTSRPGRCSSASPAGGLYAVNYAAAHPEKVQKLYLDAPVLDIYSWPGGFGEGVGSPDEWEDCKRLYGITDADRAALSDNPLDKITILLEHEIPIVLVAGDADEVVPYRENGRRLYAEYLLEGGPIQLHLKPGCGHHSHSLDDPLPIVQFLMREERGAFLDEGP